MAGEETLIGRVTERINRDRYQGPERRDRPVEWLKWLPLAGVFASGIYGYAQLHSDVAAMQRDQARIEAKLDKHVDKSDNTHAALWRKVTE